MAQVSFTKDIAHTSQRACVAGPRPLKSRQGPYYVVSGSYRFRGLELAGSMV